MELITPPLRPRCQRCLRALKTCICKWINPVQTEAEVLILQHPLEVHQAKGSGRLLHLNLPNSRLIEGEIFSEEVLRAHLYNSKNGIKRQPVLLYPDTVSLPAPPIALPCTSAEITLVIIDATWKKSRKMMFQHPQLQQLPRLQLNPVAASAYSIRKAHQPEQRSSYEAACLALRQLGCSPDDYDKLMASFSHFIAEQSRFLPLRPTA
jgi:DTW domain-containing protein YfiP